MLRLLIRFLGLVLLAGGFAALIVDGTRSLAGGELRVTPLSRSALDLFPAKMQAWQTAVEQHLPLLWDPVIVTLLLAPLSLTLTGLGALLIALSQKRRRPIDYAGR
ncbi:MAG: hypothetical protein C3F11_11890 [Methylocystaceae bacterium]|nr:MAG: hypothetical protein C3F11_11890 [Methylocystaceae bacterium]